MTLNTLSTVAHFIQNLHLPLPTSATEAPSPALPEEPVPFGEHTDVRQLIRGPVPTREDVYEVEPTSWGVGEGFVPPCAASIRAEQREAGEMSGTVELPPVPPLPAIVRRHPPQPFRLFDGVEL